jgi:hypothetical protein
MTKTAQLFILATALTLSTAVANAQAAYTAKIPFAFQAGRTQLPAGDYELRALNYSGSPVIAIYHAGSHRSVILNSLFPIEGAERKAPQLLFGCGNGNCRLEQLWKGAEGWVFAAPAKSATGHEYTASIALHGARSD